MNMQITYISIFLVSLCKCIYIKIFYIYINIIFPFFLTYKNSNCRYTFVLCFLIILYFGSYSISIHKVIFFLCYCCVVLHCMTVPSLIQPVSYVCGHVNGFWYFIATDSVTLYILKPVYFQIVGGTIWGWIPRRGIAVFNSQHICSSVRYRHIPFHKGMVLCIPTNNVRDHLFPYNLSKVVWWFYFLWEIVFCFSFFFLICELEHLFINLMTIFIFCQLCVHVFCPFFCCASFNF